MQVCEYLPALKGDIFIFLLTVDQQRNYRWTKPESLQGIHGFIW